MIDRDVEPTEDKGHYGYCPYCELDDATFEKDNDVICIDCMEKLIDEWKDINEIPQI